MTASVPELVIVPNIAETSEAGCGIQASVTLTAVSVPDGTAVDSSPSTGTAREGQGTGRCQRHQLAHVISFSWCWRSLS